MSAQWFTLLGVVLGALFSYIGTMLSERARFRREEARQWRVQQAECYAQYLGEIKEMSTIARRIAAYLGLDDQAREIAPDIGLERLAELEARRGHSSELVTLIGSVETVEAHRELNRAIWRLEHIVAGKGGDADHATWQQARAYYTRSIDAFHHATRAELGISGAYCGRNPLE